MNDTTILQDAGTDIEAMTLQQIEAALRSYSPATAAAVAHDVEHRARRQALWAKLDALLGVRKPDAATPSQRGAQQA
jgi:hypothetical protein